MNERFQNKYSLMRILSALVLLFLFSQSHAQTYVKVYYDQYPIYAQAISEHDANGVIIAGKSNEDGLIFRVDNYGDLLWQKTLFNSSTTYPKFDFYQVVPVSDSNFVIAARASNNTTQSINSLIMKIDGDGNELWRRTFDNDALHQVTHATVTETADSGYVFAWGSVQQGQGFSVVRLDQNGNDLWSKSFNTVQPTFISDINRLNDSTYIMVGVNELTSAPNYDGIVLAIDDSGTILWSKTYPAMLFDDLEIHNSKLVACGKNINNSGSLFYTFGDLNGNFDVEYSSGWSEAVMLDEFSKITSLTDSTYFLYRPTSYWSGQGFEIDSNGNVLQFVETDPRMRDVMKTSEEGVLLLGQGPLYGIKSIWPEHIGTVRLDSTLIVANCGGNSSMSQNSVIIAPVDTLEWTAGTTPISTNITVTEGGINLVDTMSCIQFVGSVSELSNELEMTVYPTISSDLFIFETSNSEPFSVEIISATGQVAISKENLHSTEEISLKSFANGVYYYKAYANDGRQKTGKIILQK